MSYDVSLYVDTGAGGRVACFEQNMTSNVAPMWRKAGVDLAELSGLPAWRAVDTLAAAIECMQSYPEDYRPLEPANGWGDYEGCLKFLVEIRDACRTHPRAEIHVSH